MIKKIKIKIKITASMYLERRKIVNSAVSVRAQLVLEVIVNDTREYNYDKNMKIIILRTFRYKFP